MEQKLKSGGSVTQIMLREFDTNGGGGGVSAKCEVMGFCLRFATSKKGAGLPLLCAIEIFHLGCVEVCIYPFFGLPISTSQPLPCKKNLGGITVTNAAPIESS